MPELAHLERLGLKIFLISLFTSIPFFLPPPVQAAFNQSLISVRYDVDDGGDPCESAYFVDVVMVSSYVWVGYWGTKFTGEVEGGYASFANWRPGKYLFWHADARTWCLPGQESGSGSSASVTLETGQEVEVILALANVPQEYREPKAGKVMGEISGKNRFSGGGAGSSNNSGAAVGTPDGYVFVSDTNGGRCFSNNGVGCITKIELETGKPVLEFPNYAQGINEGNFDPLRSSHVAPVHALVYSENNLWSLSSVGGLLNKFEANSGRLLFQRRLLTSSDLTMGIVLSSASLWVSTSQSQILKVDPSSGDTLATLNSPAGTPLYRMATLGNYVWVIEYGGNNIFRVNTSTNTLAGPFTIWNYACTTGNCPGYAHEIVSDGSSLWIYGNSAEPTGLATDRHLSLSQIDPNTGNQIGWYSQRGDPFYLEGKGEATVFEGSGGPTWSSGTARLAYAGGKLWLLAGSGSGVSDPDYEKRIYLFDPTLKTLEGCLYYPGGRYDTESGSRNSAVSVINGGRGEVLTVNNSYYGLTIISDSCGGVRNNPPDAPSNPSPAHEATVVDINADLSWTGSDPDGDPLTYDVYFGTANPPTNKVSSDQSATSYEPGTMSSATLYYWQIMARDDKAAETSGGVWSFTTNRAPFGNLDNPPNGAAVSGTYNILGWALDDGGINRVEVHIDGVSSENAIYGDLRQDVCNTYPGYPNCPNVGFRKAWDTTGYANGSSHTVYVKAYDAANLNWQSDTRTVTVSNNRQPTGPTSLLTNNQTNPTNLTGIPFFSAVYNDPDVGDTANRYWIQVDDNSDFSSSYWDSGDTAMSNCTQGSRCQDISYNGSSLSAGVRYYWQIMYRDIGGLWSPWSNENAYFELQAYGNVIGYVWRDDVADCVRDDTEQNKQGVDVTISGPSGTFSMPTDNRADFNYSFSNLLPGDYTVTVTVPSGWRATTRTSVTVQVDGGQTTQASPICL